MLKSLRRRPTIGLLIDWVALPFHAALMNAVHDVCEQKDYHLVTFVAGQLGSQRVTERCRNLLADLAGPDVVDGLLVSASTLESYAGHDHLESRLRAYHPLPVVTLHDRFPGIPAVAVDNRLGVRMLLDHLTQVHGYRRFAFVAGKTGRHDFDERRAAWREYLAEHGLSFREDLVFQGDYGPESGVAAVRCLLPKRDEFDVLVLSNDAMAVGATQELARRGTTFPLVGFDNSQQAAQDSLTTVHQSLHDQALLALGILEAQWAGSPAPAQTRERPRLVLRGSCGCSEPHVRGREGVSAGEEPSIDDAGPLSENDLDGLYDLGEAMFSTLEQKEEIRRAVLQFRQFGVEGCGICLYDEPSVPLSTAHLTLAYDGETDFKLDGEGLQFATRALLPPGVFDRSRRRSLMVQALFCGPEQIGFAVFAIQTRKWRIYEMLRRELSLALKGSRLVRAALSQTGELERRVEERTQALQAANAELQMQYEEKARIEAELTRREARYRELIMKTPALVLELDALLRPLFINQSGLEMLGLESLEARKMVPFLTYVHPDDRATLESALQTALDFETPATGEFRLLSVAGRTANIVFEANALSRGPRPTLRLSGINVSNLFANVTRPEEVLFAHYRFTPRVREVLEHLLRGAAPKDIAADLGLSENTVKTHIRSIYQEVGVSSRSGLFKILREYQVHHFGHGSYILSLLSTLTDR